MTDDTSMAERFAVAWRDAVGAGIAHDMLEDMDARDRSIVAGTMWWLGSPDGQEFLRSLGWDNRCSMCQGTGTRGADCPCCGMRLVDDL